MAALCRSKLAKTFNALQFLVEVQNDFGLQPTLEIFNCVLAMGIKRKETALQVAAILKDMEARN